MFYFFHWLWYVMLSFSLWVYGLFLFFFVLFLDYLEMHCFWTIWGLFQRASCLILNSFKVIETFYRHKQDRFLTAITSELKNNACSTLSGCNVLYILIFMFTALLKSSVSLEIFCLLPLWYWENDVEISNSNYAFTYFSVEADQFLLLTPFTDGSYEILLSCASWYFNVIWQYFKKFMGKWS